MSIGEILRNKAYFILDRLKGGYVTSQMKDLEFVSSEKKKNGLLSLLKHASTTTRFYSKYVNCRCLSDFPVVKKDIIKKDVTSFMSSKYSAEELIPVHTSGSYGIPFTFYLTPQKKARQHAEVLYYGQWAGYTVGTSHAYIRSTPFKSALKKYMQNEVFFACANLDNKFIDESLALLQRNKIKIIIGFPSAISFLANASLDRGKTFADYNIKGVITSSENLTNIQRANIKKAFGCIVNSRYSTEEFGVLANECRFECGFHINDSSYIIEVLKLNSDEPADDGEVGRIIVTDLYSHAMPLIRYEVGDLGVISNRVCKCGVRSPMLEKFSGRTMQILLNTKGDKIFPMAFDTIMEAYPTLMQYQIIQQDETKYDLNIVSDNNDLNIDFDEMRNNIANWLGENAEVNIRLVNEIEQLPSGKRPYIVNNYINITI